MKPKSHLPPEAMRAVLEGHVEELGLNLKPESAASLLRHLTAVLHHNAVTNLTAITDPIEAVRLHIIDSLAIIPYMGSCSGTILDIGSGAGFPGIPLAIMLPECTVVLVEANGKKAAFLSRMVQKLSLEERAIVRCERAEEVARKAPEEFLRIVTRAVGPLPALVELAAPLLAMGGRLFAMKALPAASEIEWSIRTAGQCGLSLEEVIEYQLPHGCEKRTLVKYRRVGEPTIPLPRRIGMAQKRPLGKP